MVETPGGFGFYHDFRLVRRAIMLWAGTDYTAYPPTLEDVLRYDEHWLTDLTTARQLIAFERHADEFAKQVNELKPKPKVRR